MRVIPGVVGPLALRLSKCGRGDAHAPPPPPPPPPKPPPHPRSCAGRNPDTRTPSLAPSPYSFTQRSPSLLGRGAARAEALEVRAGGSPTPHHPAPNCHSEAPRGISSAGLQSTPFLATHLCLALPVRLPIPMPREESNAPLSPTTPHPRNPPTTVVPAQAGTSTHSRPSNPFHLPSHTQRSPSAWWGRVSCPLSLDGRGLG